MRATTEEINGVWQGACYPFREGLSTGIMNVEFTPAGQLIAGGFTTNRQWPVRGEKPYALDRLDWTGITPFEIQEINIRQDGFRLKFTKPVEREIAALPETYNITSYTHIYAGFYGSPEVDQTTPVIDHVEVSENGMEVRIYLNEIQEGHIHDFDLTKMKSRDAEPLLHKRAYYTVNEIPQS
jgi:hypothetical protein